MKRILIIFFGLWISVSAFAQGGNHMHIEAQYRSQKIAFITDKMQLTPEESEAFWPIYKQLEAEKDELAKEMHAYRANFPQQEEDLTDDQAKDLLAHFNKHTVEIHKLDQEYQKKFLNVISAKKFLLLKSAENGFRKHLLREFKGRGRNRRNN